MSNITETLDTETENCCSPIKDLKSVLNWDETNFCRTKLDHVVARYKRCNYAYNGTTSDSRKYLKSDLPKTLLCHDMKGGYLEDRFIHGTNVVEDPYVFSHWNYVDSFVYFSHHFITIPPPMWINAAHLHGVHILGTLITEWTDGEKLWQELFEDETKLNLLVQKLVQICEHYKFDGYLINIENKVPPEHMEKLKNFVEKLTDQIHIQVQDSVVIWYDSVVYPKGELKWQNELNESNKDFFKCCDGIFLNYNWTEETLATSLKNAGVRKHDVYVGVDVFGRGCYGGGGFNSNLALEVIRKFDLSAAIFGQGWTHETKKPEESFLDRENLFWSKLKSYLYINVRAFSEKFSTHFNSGYGKLKFSNGYRTNNTGVYNLSNQCIQPIVPHNFVYEEGFHGAGCLELKQSEPTYHRLFFTEIEIQNRFEVCLTTKCETAYDYKIFIIIEHKLPYQKHKYILRKEEKLTDENLDYSTTVVKGVKTGRAHKKLITIKGDWDTRSFIIDPKHSSNIVEIAIEFESESGQMLLGELEIKKAS